MQGCAPQKSRPAQGGHPATVVQLTRFRQLAARNDSWRTSPRATSRHSPLNAFYTLSKALDDCYSDSGTCSGVAPITNRNLNKGRAGYDRQQVAVANATYELPIGKGRHFLNHNKVLDYLIGGSTSPGCRPSKPQPVWLQLHQQLQPLLSVQHLELCSQPVVQWNFNAPIRAGQNHRQRRQSLQPGGRGWGSERELLRGRPPSRREMRDAIS